MLAFGFSEYHEKFISSRERKDEGERTNGTEEGHGSPATGSWSGSGGGGGPRVTESPGFFWLGHRSLTGHLRDSSPSCYIMGTSSDDFSIDCLHVGERENGWPFRGASAWAFTYAPGYAPYHLSCVERGMTSSQGAIKRSGRNESAPLFLPSSIGGGAFDDLGD